MSGTGVPFGNEYKNISEFTREEFTLLIEGLYHLDNSDKSVENLKKKIRSKILEIDEKNPGMEFVDIM